MAAVHTVAATSASITANEHLTISAARELRDDGLCFAGIGLPMLAANLARRTFTPNLVLVYESGAIGADPAHPLLSTGGGELAATADRVVSVTEMFSYWLRAGCVGIGFPGAAQIDR